MAQRTIHYLFGELICREIPLSDKKRFLLGSILPDAIDTANRDTSHFIVETRTHKFFDFAAFRNQYPDLINQDDLYLGYYMHLVEDAFYRAFFYNSNYTMPRSREEVPMLHQDYHILNDYIVKKYQLQNCFDLTISLKDTPLLDLTTFYVDKLLTDLSNDFTEQTQGKTTYITEQMLDLSVEHYIPLAIAEVKSMQAGTSLLQVSDFIWPNQR